MTVFPKCTSTHHSEFTCLGYHLLVKGTRNKFPFGKWCEACRTAYPDWKYQ